MVALPQSPARAVPRARYVKIPETQHVKTVRDRWLMDWMDIDPLQHMSSCLSPSTRMSIGAYRHSHWYATIVTTSVEAPSPNALSGWGDTAHAALLELLFRWHCCLRGSWCVDGWDLNIVPLFHDAWYKPEVER